jgi:hypothetical protein
MWGNILTHIGVHHTNNGPLLFSLLGQCFQDVGLTEWTSFIAKQCLDDADHTKANFDECIRDYLEAIAEFPNIGDQLICWLCTPRSLLSCRCMSSCGMECSFSSTSRVTTSVELWTYPQSKRRVNRSSLQILRCTRTSSPT